MKNGKRSRNTFKPEKEEAFKLSRTKIEMFLRCARCFYLDRRLGISQPSIPPYTLNNAVDLLMKKEFDTFRAQGKVPPLLLQNHLDVKLFASPLLERWRDNRHGIQYLHQESNFLVFGAVDDIWEDPEGRLIVVDYKATSSEREITLEDGWKDSYKRQMDVYRWLLMRNEYPVSDTGYFVFVNADKTRADFGGRLEFVHSVIPYMGDCSWVDDALMDIHSCLRSETMPKASDDCEWCQYRVAAQTVEEKPLSPVQSLFD